MTTSNIAIAQLAEQGADVDVLRKDGAVQGQRLMDAARWTLMSPTRW